MNKKVGPFILFGVLIIILIFAVGVKYGKKVAKTDTVINFLLSITPTKSPDVTKPLEFKTYKNAGCGVQFLYPAAYKIQTDASEEAVLSENSFEVLHVYCSKANKIKTMISDPKLATEEVKLKNQTLKMRVEKIDNSQSLIFQTKNPLTTTSIYVSVDKKFYPLFESTLQFNPIKR